MLLFLRRKNRLSRIEIEQDEALLINGTKPEPPNIGLVLRLHLNQDSSSSLR